MDYRIKVIIVDLQLTDDKFESCSPYLPQMHYCSGEGVNAKLCCSGAGIKGNCLDICNAGDVSCGTNRNPYNISLSPHSAATA
jgi:hypothetical protein